MLSDDTGSEHKWRKERLVTLSIVTNLLYLIGAREAML